MTRVRAVGVFSELLAPVCQEVEEGRSPEQMGGSEATLLLQVLVGVRQGGRALGKTWHFPSPKPTALIVNQVTGVLGKTLSVSL